LQRSNREPKAWPIGAIAVAKFMGIRSQLLGLVAAAVLPFLVLIGVGLWNQSRIAQAEALNRALGEARVLAAQIDDHLGNVENLMIGLSRAVSTDPADVKANDGLLAGVKAELPGFMSDIVVATPDGENIGSASGNRFSVADRSHFTQILAGQSIAIGDPVRSRVDQHWIFPVARAIRNSAGELQAVLIIGTSIENFRGAVHVSHLPAGSTVRITNERGIAVAAFPDVPDRVGRDLSKLGNVSRWLRAREGSEFAIWNDQVTRVTGYSTAYRAPWLVTVGMPMDVASAAVATKLKLGGLYSFFAIAVGAIIAWMLSGRIIRPLRQLERDAAILASGELSHRTSISSVGEFGRLADAFNRMASSLERRRNARLEHADDLRRAKNTLDSVIDASPVAIACSNLDRKVFLWNRAAEDIYGYSESEVLGQKIKIVPPDMEEAARELHRRACSGEVVRGIETRRLRKDGISLDIRLAAAPLFAEDGAVRGVAFVHEDITARKQAEQQLRQFAHFDQLTGLANRLTMRERLGSLLEDNRRQSSIAILDLDGFKDVNDTLGHSTGDRLLIEVAARLKAAVASRAPDALACRLGGDEFVIVVPDCGSPLLIAEVVGEALTRLSQTYVIGEHVLQLGASAGIAIGPRHGSGVDELLSSADLALYQAKKSGGRAYRFFTPALRANAQSRRVLDSELRHAFANGEFELYYQPQVRLCDNAVTGAEALLRWRHPVRGLLDPHAFIEALAGNALAPDVGRWVIETACAQAAEWRSQGFSLARMAVNLFPKQLQDSSLIAVVEAALRRSDLPPDLLELEITENIALNHEEAAKPLAQLREQGVKIAFDDFGTGYASLRYLTLFPVSRIKIDRSFVHDIANGAKSAAIVRSLIGMAQSLGLEVIAEGVETSAQAAFLRNERCEEAQGFLYGKPLSAVDFAVYLSVARLVAAIPGDRAVIAAAAAAG
jgi:diguanylate cyclase (GGDEF)-like protein/PAS domain S-box-containing protein